MPSAKTIRRGVFQLAAPAMGEGLVSRNEIKPYAERAVAAATVAARGVVVNELFAFLADRLVSATGQLQSGVQNN